ncbi:MAG: Asp-tRNA(Asn)/Glu-tRNA(Gln) amidotransferase subunit GatB [Patescibacteria group bacterium]
MKNYKPTIGLEIHAQLHTKSKMFCRCINDPDERRPNVNICPICTGQPGTLPVANKEAIRKMLQIGAGLNGELADFTEFDRKHYFYPDIPKGYQISQHQHPLVKGGELSGVTLTRIHLEEDTARSTHDRKGGTYIDFNRSGLPLMELVTEPEIESGKKAAQVAKELQLLLRYLDAGKANMEKGEMRVEANLSVSDSEKLGTKVEVKNLNSFKAVEKAVAFEIERHIDLLEKGEKIIQETRGWDEEKQITVSQRKKEESHDYRYFPEPDIPPFVLSEFEEFSLDSIKRSLPELPWDKRDRYKKDFNLPDEQVEVFINSPVLALFFEDVIKEISSVDKEAIKKVVNYIATDLVGLMKEEEKGEVPFSSSQFAELMNMIIDSELSSRGGKDVLSYMYKGDKGSAREIAERYELIQSSDSGELDFLAEEVIKENTQVAEDYKGGKESSLQFLVGQGMKKSKGSANPKMLSEALKEKLS